jgi:uncharacterized protein YndB with AHSA1/START domain
MAETTKTTSMFTLPSDVEISGSRVLDATPDLVYRAYTDPTVIPQWWGPSRYTTTVDKLELRPGGPWRFVHRAADGGEHAFSGVFREVVPSKRLVFTFNYEALPGHEAVETVTFEAVAGGKTRVTDNTRFQNREDRDGMLQSGMEEGAAESIERLTKVLQKLQAERRS